MTNRGAAIAGYYLAGVLAAAQLGKMSALAPLIAAELQLSLPVAAAAISLLEIGGATLGLVAGLLASRLGLGRTLLAALLCLVAAAAGGALAGGAPALLGWRLVEALGYLGVVVTAPVLIVRTAPPARLGAAMALWSTFVPVGMAVGASGSAAIAAAAGWRSAMLVGGALTLAVALACAALQRGQPTPAAAAPPASRAVRGGSAAVWTLSASFGCYALFQVGLLALLPLYFTGVAGLAVAEAGRWAALAALATIVGSAAAALWLRRGFAVRGAVLVVLLLPAGLLFGVFASEPAPLRAVVLALLLNAVSGTYPGFAFAWLPRLAGDGARLVRANGIFTQFGASGSLLGPPLMAAAVERFGWPGAAGGGLVMALASALLALAALRSLR